MGCHWNVHDLYGCLRGMDQGMATDKRRTGVLGGLWNQCSIVFVHMYIYIYRDNTTKVKTK